MGGRSRRVVKRNRADAPKAPHVCCRSAHAGARKPHPRIFEHTLARCRVDAADTVFVGDSFGPDVEGPLGVGIPTAVHVYRPGEEPPRAAPPLPEGAVRVNDLRGVLDIV